MSILIKDMQMPSSCLKGGCPLDGFACKLWEDINWASYEDPEKGRHRDCPLIELPDHGDLIDRDALLSKIQKWYWEALETVKRMPAVIPAERDVAVCPLHSDDEVTEYCVEGPCTDEMEGRCPLTERNEDPSHPFADSVMMGDV